MNKQKAEIQVRIYPMTHKRLKMKAAKYGHSLSEVIDNLSKAIHYPIELVKQNETNA